ncbi:MAG: cytochrome C [Synechococcales cyanobacterium RM1_1_8]|nr:cytochrome C [Synechococcales cyanobacterium RM1_1_8]
MGLASTVAQAPASAPPSGLGLPLTVDLPRSVDYVPEAHQLGQRLYLENCATCHIGVPPETLPSEAWRTLIQDSNHYGSEIQLPQGPSRALIWAYLRGFSRLKAEQEERVPYRLGRSRYFQAIHPNVALPSDLSLQSCASCHIAAAQFSFRPWREGGDP